MNSSVVSRCALLLGVLALVIGVGVLFLPSAGTAKRAEAYSPSIVITHKLFLPLVAKPFPPGIAGTVNVNGAAAPGIGVNLEFYDGVTTSIIMSANTGPDGVYQFLGAPSLAKGQHYDVKYQRPTGITDTLRSWTTNSITGYVSGASVGMPPFDIANVPLLQPSANTTVTLPFNFQWTVRPSTHTDSYAFEIRNSAVPTTFSSGQLGYVGNFNLTTVPVSFTTGVQYPWFIRVQSPDGGVGFTASQDVAFQ